MDDIQIIHEPRERMTFEELRRMMAWSWGDRGRRMADLWQSLNRQCWDGRLTPAPIWFPSAPPYGHWWGQYTGGPERTTHHIQIKRGLSDDDAADVLLHEMIHQYLYETGQATAHNSRPWCDEIMRMTKLIWGRDIYAAPSEPRRVNGKSRRIQKLGPNGEKSIPLKAISGWPHSLGLHVPFHKAKAAGAVA